MNATKWILVLMFLGCSFGLPKCGTPTLAQQTSAVPEIEREFFDAIKKGDSEKVRELLRQKPALIQASTKNGTTPVLFAVFTNRREITESLIATGIEPNIFEAAATGRVERIRTLLESDPTLVKAYSPDGWTALHLNWGNLQIAELLLDSGADINAVSKNKFVATPLQSAVGVKWTPVARLLVERGANVNCRGEEGGTPLHEASANGEVEFAKMLLDHGADINAKDDNGKTPLAIALESKQTEMAKFLRERQAK